VLVSVATCDILLDLFANDFYTLRSRLFWLLSRSVNVLSSMDSSAVCRFCFIMTQNGQIESAVTNWYLVNDPFSESRLNKEGKKEIIIMKISSYSKMFALTA